MYEEKKKRYTLKDLSIQILVILLFVLIILWLFPTKKNMKNYVDKNGNTNDTTENGKNNGKNNNTNNNNGKNSNSGSSTEKEKMYEYRKDSNATYSEWGNYSDWSTEYVAATDLVDVQTEVRTVLNGQQSYNVQVGTETVDYVVGTVTNNKAVVGQTTEKAIVGYKYDKVQVGTEKVLVRTDVVKEKQKVQVGTVEELVEKKSGAVIPNNTDEYVYKELSKVTKDGSTVYIYGVYKIKPVYKIVEVETETPIYEEKPVYETRRVPVYGVITKDVFGTKTTDITTTKDVPVYETQTTDNYVNVTYYRFRTREKLSGSSDVKYSTKENDEELIKQGYKYTGNVKTA